MRFDGCDETETLAGTGPRHDSPQDDIGRQIGLARQLVESLGLIMWVHSPDYEQLHYISPAYERVWGLTPQSLYECPASWVDSIHVTDRGRVRAALGQLIDGYHFSQAYRLLRPDGVTSRVRHHASPIRDHLGEVFCIAGICEDALDGGQHHLRLDDSNARRGTYATEQELLQHLAELVRERRS